MRANYSFIIDFNDCWITDNGKFNDIRNKEDIIEFKWINDVSLDYIKLSETFFDAAEMIAIKLNEAKQDYSKYDEWFFADIYLYRQAIELLCKGLLIKYTSYEEVTEILNKNNHNNQTFLSTRHT